MYLIYNEIFIIRSLQAVESSSNSLIHSFISMSLYSRLFDLVGAERACSLNFNRYIVTLLVGLMG